MDEGRLFRLTWPQRLLVSSRKKILLFGLAPCQQWSYPLENRDVLVKKVLIWIDRSALFPLRHPIQTSWLVWVMRLAVKSPSKWSTLAEIKLIPYSKMSCTDCPVLFTCLHPIKLQPRPNFSYWSWKLKDSDQFSSFDGHEGTCHYIWIDNLRLSREYRFYQATLSKKQCIPLYGTQEEGVGRGVKAIIRGGAGVKISGKFKHDPNIISRYFQMLSYKDLEFPI